MDSTNGNHSCDDARAKAEDCRIIHIPERPQVLPHLQPTGKIE